MTSNIIAHQGGPLPFDKVTRSGDFLKWVNIIQEQGGGGGGGGGGGKGVLLFST